MKLARNYGIVYLIITILQATLMINHKTRIFSYWLNMPFILILLNRASALGRLLYLPISWVFNTSVEIVVFLLSMFIFISVQYKNSYPTNWVNLIIVIVAELVLLGLILFEGNYYVYTTKEYTIYEDKGL